MKITVCIGSSCHLKGSRQVVEVFQRLIAENGLKDRVELNGTFCMGDCRCGVCITIDGERLSVSPDTAEAVFNERVLAGL